MVPGLGSGALGLPPFIPSTDGLSKIVQGLPTILPTVDDLTGLGGILGGVLDNTGSSSTTTSRVQATAVQKESGMFKWIESYLTPEMFATPDSCLIGIGKSTYSANQVGGEFELLGVCSSASFNSQSNIYTIKEMRQESTRMIAMKSGPGVLTLSRMLTSNPTILGRLTGKTWAFDTQTPAAKKMFGIVMIFMSPDRQSTYSTLYFERCLIGGISVSINAGVYQIHETMQIQYNRVKDTSANDSASQTQSGTNWINQVGREGGTEGLGYAATPEGNTSTTPSSTPTAGGPPATKPPEGNTNPSSKYASNDYELYGPTLGGPVDAEDYRTQEAARAALLSARYKYAESNTPY
jgi:hypothetical protein